MGTRHFIGAIVDGDFKIAQYGQWDGYLEGAGAAILAFIQGFHVTGSDTFRAQLRKCRWLTEPEIDNINSEMKKRFAGRNLSDVYPMWGRDAGARILSMVAESQDGEIRLLDRRGFPADSLFCEYAYVIDMDAEVLEVYRGFNTEPVPESERFSHANWPYADKDINEKYGPVRYAFSVPFSEAYLGFTREHERALGYEDEEEAA